MLTIITPAASKDLTTRARIKSILKITRPDEDSNIDWFIKSASAAVAQFCNRTFAQEVVSEQIRMPMMDLLSFPRHPARHHPYKLVLSRFPISTIASVIEDGTTLDPTVPDYECELSRGILTRIREDGESSWYAQKVVVQYTAGYVLPDCSDGTPTLPPDIEEATIRIVTMMRSNAAMDPRIKGETVVGVLETDYWVGSITGAGTAFPPEAAALLSQYVRVSIG